MDHSSAPNWGNIITWLLVFAGWVAVHFMALARERRKEKRDLAKSITAEIRDIERAAIDLHSADVFNSLKEAELRDSRAS